MKPVKWLIFGAAAAVLPVVALSSWQRRQQLAQRVQMLEQQTRLVPVATSSARVPFWARDWEAASPAKRG
jgi:hypothetical protein